MTYDQIVRNRIWTIQDGGLQTGKACTSAFRLDSNAVSMAIPMFSQPFMQGD